MTFLEKFNCVRRLHNLIKMNATGNHQQLARKLFIPVSTLYRDMEILKSLGAPIVYCSTRQCYYYEEDFEIEF